MRVYIVFAVPVISGYFTAAVLSGVLNWLFYTSDLFPFHFSSATVLCLMAGGVRNHVGHK